MGNSLTFKVRGLDGLAGVDEPALIGPARQVAEVLPKVGKAGRAARQHRLGQVEILLHVADLNSNRFLNALYVLFIKFLQNSRTKGNMGMADTKRTGKWITGNDFIYSIAPRHPQQILFQIFIKGFGLPINRTYKGIFDYN